MLIYENILFAVAHEDQHPCPLCVLGCKWRLTFVVFSSLICVTMDDDGDGLSDVTLSVSAAPPLVCMILLFY